MASDRNNGPGSVSSGPVHDFRDLLGGAEESITDDLALADGSRIAVIGGGPAGSLFSFFALKMARMLGRDLSITIFEPKDFLGRGTKSCNHCGGIVSELMVQTLAMEGINIPSSVVQRGVNSYQLYTDLGDVRIETPSLEKTIAAVYRGGGPRGVEIEDKDSFDNFLLQSAVREGAQLEKVIVESVKFEDGKPVLFGGGQRLLEADLVVGAFGVNTNHPPRFEGVEFKYTTPTLMKTAIAEIALDPDYIDEKFGNSVHLFLLPIKGFKFAAIIPKRSYVTLCILGKNLNKSKLDTFLSHPRVNELFPPGALDKLACMCLPAMNVGPPKVGYADRVVMVGDTGSTRLYKDGIGAAYFMGKSAAKTVIMQGVGVNHFKEGYLTDYRSLIIDNRYGQFLFKFTDLFRDFRFLTSSMLRVVRKEQTDHGDENKILSTILWDMFTGNERYRAVFLKAISPEMIIKMTKSIFIQLFGGSKNGK